MWPDVCVVLQGVVCTLHLFVQWFARLGDAGLCILIMHHSRRALA
jgi:hypothetical protein